MTKDEILNMPAGREMDVNIGYHIMGLVCPPEMYPNYSTNISDAWKVIEKLNSIGAWVSLSKGADNFTWDFRGIINEGNKDEIRFINHAENAPLAICRAALLAQENN